uniref:Uncharacterized protein n=1 Tax=Megaselia scalaris TaxID=36166 RepID=T1GQS0_MEGSC
MLMISLSDDGCKDLVLSSSAGMPFVPALLWFLSLWIALSTSGRFGGGTSSLPNECYIFQCEVFAILKAAETTMFGAAETTSSRHFLKC